MSTVGVDCRWVTEQNSLIELDEVGARDDLRSRLRDIVLRDTALDKSFLGLFLPRVRLERRLVRAGGEALDLP